MAPEVATAVKVIVPSARSLRLMPLIVQLPLASIVVFSSPTEELAESMIDNTTEAPGSPVPLTVTEWMPSAFNGLIDAIRIVDFTAVCVV